MASSRSPRDATPPGPLVAVTEPSVGRSPLEALRPALALVALAVLAFNLRTPTASLPPLLGDVQGALGLSGAAAGLLTALPVLCMALCAPAAQRLGGRTAIVLFAGTLVAGIGIAVSGVTLPSIIKDRFPDRPGAATAAYSVPMMLGAAVAPALAVPLARSLGSWQAP